MTLEQLAAILSRMYEEAPHRQKVAHIHLFGIRHARDIAAAGVSASAVVERSDVSDVYVSEVQKGIVLAKYVVERSELRRVLLGED